jgi:hypothetical protein
MPPLIVAAGCQGIGRISEGIDNCEGGFSHIAAYEQARYRGRFIYPSAKIKFVNGHTGW